MRLSERTIPTYDHLKRRISSQFRATTLASLESVASPDCHAMTVVGRAEAQGWIDPPRPGP